MNETPGRIDLGVSCVLKANVVLSLLCTAQDEVIDRLEEVLERLENDEDSDGGNAIPVG